MDTIVEKAGVKATDVVLEIGPGTGNLTMKLLAAAKRVVAIEYDPRMVLELQRRVAGTPAQHNLEACNCPSRLGLALSCSPSDNPGRRSPRGPAVLRPVRGQHPVPDLLAPRESLASLFHLSSLSPLRPAQVFKLLSHRPVFRAAVIMFQTEFAMRLVAQPSDSTYTRLSVNTQLLARVTHLMKVGRNNFRPPPKVDSSVVRIEPRHPAPDVNFREWDGLLRLCFGRKNKTLGGIFRQKSTLELLESNYRTWQALQLGTERAVAPVVKHRGKAAPAPAAAPVWGEDAEMGEAGGAGTESEAFKATVVGVLEAIGMEGARSSKLTQDDFLKLLAAFNAQGIHFS